MSPQISPKLQDLLSKTTETAKITSLRSSRSRK